MTQDIDFSDPDGSALGKPPVVGYCYWEPAKASSQDLGEALMYCLDCDDPNAAPPNYGRTRIRQDGKYGSVVGHLDCDDCGIEFTRRDP